MKEYIEPEGTYEIVVKIKSTRVKFQKIQDYIPIMSESKYSVAVSQLEDHGALHTDANMFLMKTILEEQPDIMAAIMTQLSINAGLKYWGTRTHEAVQSDSKQLNFR